MRWEPSASGTPRGRNAPSASWTTASDAAGVALEIRARGGPINQPPSVDAGPDLAVALPNAATLDGTVTDDGLPAGTLPRTWSQVSGPAAVSFADERRGHDGELPVTGCTCCA